MPNQPICAAPIADVPTVELQAGTDLIVYAVGSLDGGSFTFYTQTISGLGGGPTLVNTGDGLPADGTSSAMILLAAGAGLFAAAGGTVVALRRRAAN